MKPSIKQVENTVTKRLDEIVSRSSGMQGYFMRNVYRQYQKAQQERWKSENKTEGNRWSPLEPTYKRRKLTRFKDYPGHGTKMLVATGKLFQSVIGPGEFHVVQATDSYLFVSTTLDYAKWVAEERPFMKFGQKTLGTIRRGISDFIVRGKK